MQSFDPERIEVEGGLPDLGIPPSTSTRSGSKSCVWPPPFQSPFLGLTDEKGLAINHDLKDILKYLKKNGATKDELKNVNSAFNKIHNSINKQNGKSEKEIGLTDKEKQIVRKFAFMPSTPKSISHLMNKFVSDFKKHAQQDIHSIALVRHLI